MSYSLKVKEELSNLPTGKYEENKAEIYSILVFSKHLMNKKYLFVSECKQLVEKISFYLYNTSENKVKTENFLFYLPFDRNLDIKKMTNNLQNLMSTSDNAYLPPILRGAFLSCGNITNPKSNYHLEFSLKDNTHSDFLVNALKKVNVANLMPKITRRKSGIYIYMKDHTQIIDFLTYIGATNSSMQFIQIKMMKEVRNYINRTTNFETANITKTTFAASEQIHKIRKLRRSEAWSKMPEHLKQTAILRLKNPYLSLSELSKLSPEPITKSGVSYRLKKILEYYK